MRFLRRSIGLRPGEPVAIYRTNDHYCFHWFLAIIRAGGIAVPLNPQLSLAKCGASSPTAALRFWSPTKRSLSAAIKDRSALNVRAWIQADEEPETIDGFVRVQDTRRAVSADHHRSCGDHGCLPYFRHQRLSQGSGSFKPCSARRARLNGVCRAFSRPQGSRSCRAALVAHHGRQHCALWPHGRNSRMLSRAISTSKMRSIWSSASA